MTASSAQLHLITFNVVAGSTVQPGMSCSPPGGSLVQCSVSAVNQSQNTVTVAIAAPPGTPHGAIYLQLGSGGAMPVALDIGDQTPELNSVNPASSSWIAGIGLTFNGSNLASCEDIEEGPCWWTDIELDYGTSAPGSWGGLADETSSSAYGTLNPGAAGGTYYFIGYCGEYYADYGGDCELGPVSMAVAAEPPPPTPSLNVTSNGQPVAQGTCGNSSQALLISATPAMPPLQAQIIMSDGSTPSGDATFMIDGSYPLSNFNTNYPPNGVRSVAWAYSNTSGPGAAVVSDIQQASLAWKPLPQYGWSAPFAGGNASINWSYGNVQGTYNFCILGTNPSQSAVTYMLAPSSPAYWYEFWFANYIAIHETNQSQFCDIFHPSQTQGAPYCGQNGGLSQQSGPFPGMPIWGTPFGYGALQVDPPPSGSTLWNWSQNLTDGIALLQTKAGSPTAVGPNPSPTGEAGYPFWNGQVAQWNVENQQRQAAGLAPVGTAETFDPAPTLPSPSVPTCTFSTSFSTSLDISVPSTDANTYWYGDAILMMQYAGTADSCGNSANYVYYVQGNLSQNTTGYWSFHKVNGVSANIVSEFCSCTTYNSCIRVSPPACQ